MEELIPEQLVEQATAENVTEVIALIQELMEDPEMPEQLRVQLQGQLLSLQRRFAD